MPSKTSPTRSNHGQAICLVWKIHRPVVQTANGVGSPRMFPAFAAVGSGYFAKDQFRSILQNVRRANKDNIGGVIFWDGAYGEQSATRGLLTLQMRKKCCTIIMHVVWPRTCQSLGGKTLTPVTLAAEDDSHGLGRSTYPQRNITSRGRSQNTALKKQQHNVELEARIGRIESGVGRSQGDAAAQYCQQRVCSRRY